MDPVTNEVDAQEARSDDGGLRVMFRPVMSLATGRITAVAPVVSSADGATFSPADVWERWPDLGFQLLERVASDVARWRDEGSPITLIVPMASSLLDERLARKAYEALRNANLSIEDLVVDVDASVFADDDRTAVWAVQDLTSVGARVAAAGFGEGAWPIPGMLEAAASEVVIDMNAIKLPGDGEAPATAIVAAAKALGWATRAVNVTRVAELGFLTRVDCGSAQGDRLAPATTTEGMAEHLRAQRAATVLSQPVDPTF